MIRLRHLGRERLLLLLAGACIALLVLDRLVLTPLLRRWQDRAEEVRRLRASIAQGNGIISQEARWLRWRDAAEGRLLPGEPAAAESLLLTQVDAWARQSGLTVKTLRPRWQEVKGQGSLPELQVAGTGTLSAVVRFLYQVETSPLALAVEHLELASGGKDESALRVDMRISGLLHEGASRTRRTES